MKKNLMTLAIALSAVTIITITGCKKSNDTETDHTADFTLQTDEQTFVSSEDDVASNDVNTVVEEDATFSGGRTSNPICDATITRSVTNTSKALTLTYNGHNCAGGRTRTGVMIVTMSSDKRWKDAGAKITVAYQNFKITRASDNKSIVLNGSKTITNISGGELKHRLSSRSITHHITSNALTITFSDGTKREWKIAKERIFSFNDGMVITTRGAHNNGTVSNISEWGINRQGKHFTTQIAEPMVIRQDCGFRLVSGKLLYTDLERPVTITFGLNANGVATNCPGTGRYFYKMEWTGIHNSFHSTIHSY